MAATGSRLTPRSEEANVLHPVPPICGDRRGQSADAHQQLFWATIWRVTPRTCCPGALCISTGSTGRKLCDSLRWSHSGHTIIALWCVTIRGSPSHQANVTYVSIGWPCLGHEHLHQVPRTAAGAGLQGPPQPAMALASRASGRAGLGRQRRGQELCSHAAGRDVVKSFAPTLPQDRWSPFL